MIPYLPGIGWSLYQPDRVYREDLDREPIIKVNPKRDYDVERFIGDPTKIESILKSRKFLTLEEGLKLAIPKYIKGMI